MGACGTSALALSGGVGGAKLVLGLADVLPPGQLHVLVNTADDFNHLGLHISPDIDTLLYTLSGIANDAQGWGLSGETWHVMKALQRLDGDTWFRLGDMDMATHLRRTGLVAQGVSLTEVTDILSRQFGVLSHIHPMCNQTVRTVVHCADGRELPFQRYFVQERCAPAALAFSFAGIEEAHPNARVMDLLQAKAFSTIVLCPSNPFVSIDPILQLRSLWPALRDNPAPTIAISPIVAGRAIKGPAAKIMAELGVSVTALGVARHYCERYPGLLDHFVIDESDASLAAAISELGIEVSVAPTVMKDRQDKRRLARLILDIIGT